MLNDKKKLLFSAVVLLLTILAFVNPLQSAGVSYVDSAFTRALAGFAIARGLNGVISVAQGTEFAVQPAGVGVSFTPGEILDPVNDLVERFSWIMLLASSSLGVQKILLAMSSWYGILVGLVIAVFALLCVFWVRGLEMPLLRSLATRFFVLMLILRFMMPAVSLANHWVYHTFLMDKYQSASTELTNAKESIGSINEEVLASEHKEDAGLMDRARELYRSAARQIDFEKRLDDYGAAAEKVSTSTIDLIVVFMMQTLVFPLIFLWIVYVLIRRLFSQI